MTPTLISVIGSRALLWICMSLFLFSSCQPQGMDISALPVEQNRTKTIQTSVQNSGDKVTTFKPRFPQSEVFVGIQFIDASHGWLGSRSSLYKTSNGGLSWVKLPIVIPKGTSLSTFRFYDFKSGWIVFQKYPEDSLDYKGNKYDILHTQDGGQRWTQQHTGIAGRVDQLNVLPEGEGWVVGREFSEKDGGQEHPLVLHTTDHGEHWLNGSDDTNLVKMKYGITSLITSKSLGITATTAHGGVMSTEGFGKGWKGIAAVEGEPDQTFFGQLGRMDDGQLWLVGGADSMEGAGGLLVKLNADGSWTKYKTNLYLSSAIFITKDQIIGCGHLIKPDTSLPLPRGREGFVAVFSESDTAWRVIYQDSAVSSIRTLERIEPNVIWAIGTEGFVARLTISQS